MMAAADADEPTCVLRVGLFMALLMGALCAGLALLVSVSGPNRGQLWAGTGAAVFATISLSFVLRFSGSRRAAVWVLVLIPAAITVCLALNPTFYWAETREWGDHPFNEALWKGAGDNGGFDSPRGRMVRSLLRDRSLIGLTREQVWRTLGPPDYVSHDPYEGDAIPIGNFWEYFVGTHRDVDPDVLILRFSKRSKVDHVSVSET